MRRDSLSFEWLDLAWSLFLLLSVSMNQIYTCQLQKNKKHDLLMYCSLYRRGLTLTLESFLLCIKIPIKKWPAITEALDAGKEEREGGVGFSWSPWKVDLNFSQTSPKLACSTLANCQFSALPFDPYEWLESNFSFFLFLQRHPQITH